MVSPILLECRDGTAFVTMNRPERRNAFDEAMVAALADAIAQAAEDDDVRALVLRGAGETFSAGADLGWMARMAEATEAENLRDARLFASMLRRLDTCPKPVVALVRGAAFGGGIGLVAAADVAVAEEGACFCLSEVILGLVPAVIGPYVLRAMGERMARRFTLTAERFDALRAQSVGLVHEVVPAGGGDEALSRLLALIHRGAPFAQAEAKHLFAHLAGRMGPEQERDEDEYTARTIARLRRHAEARARMAAFLAGRGG